MMDEYTATKIGSSVIEMFALKPIKQEKKENIEPRYSTTWGSKTVAGIGRCLGRILAENTLTKASHEADVTISK